jgi:hypothetical protein
MSDARLKNDFCVHVAAPDLKLVHQRIIESHPNSRTCAALRNNEPIENRDVMNGAP